MTQDSQDERWAGFGWNVIHAAGNDIDALDEGISAAKACKGKPTVIIADTTKGLWCIVYRKSGRLASQSAYRCRICTGNGRINKKGRPWQMNKIPNKQVICEVLMEQAKEDKGHCGLAVIPEGSGSFTAFANEFPKQFVEMGIAEQSLCIYGGRPCKMRQKAYAVSPACFLSTRVWNEAKVDVAYSNTNVKLIGISGGVSYGALGMTITQPGYRNHGIHTKYACLFPE